MTKRIAIIGTGIAGLTSAYLLHREHDITVYEANDYIGGHTATKTIDEDGVPLNIDTGFIVFNDWTYPNFIALMNQLGVDYQPTEMSFSVSSPVANLEYNGNNLSSLFAQRRNLLRPRFWKMLRDIVRFNNACKTMLESGRDTNGMTLGDCIDELGLGADFANFYILPMCAAIWSSTLAQTRAFPLTFFLKFFHNHGLLNITNRPQWHTIKGGSKQYIAPLTAGFKDRIRLSSPVRQVEKTDGGWQVTTSGGDADVYDHVIFACHSDEALAMLSQPTEAQQAILGAIPYAMNDVVLHTDIRQLPKRRRAWASWNYRLHDPAQEQHRPATVTYNMNILQRLDVRKTYCVTLNDTDSIDERCILGHYRYAHPQFSQASLAAQQRRDEICGKGNLHFCGAYWYNGFHEDGVRSALDVAGRFGASL
ncbi:NAD(P)/FAD-dependent oxidoreductase [Alteromonas sp. CYL-A6]|uniref:NAD(P)/FAD-dependent oxidoreductase n=1 Tax=Alteromonas nitratireducens TaxID=3390813 RepID=UPI0034ABCC16